jgi:hypothetical protein
MTEIPVEGYLAAMPGLFDIVKREIPTGRHAGWC